jgi:uncharacterized protein YrzB (UPF0473 family)
MEETYGSNFITVTDEDGNELELEHLDTIEWNGETYLSFFPTVQEGDEVPEEELGLIILKAITENGEEILSTLDNDEELEAVYEQFMENLYDEDEDE